jgi:predicted RNA-binding protein associated with RNAse of E/G family
LDLLGAVTWKYGGRLLHRQLHSVVLEARFDVEAVRVVDVILRAGDRFVEMYFDDRWYNVFEIFDRDDHTFKGWYCNLSRPAILDHDVISWVDLALDLWVWPDERQAVLDEDEYGTLNLEPDERDWVTRTLRELRRMSWSHQPLS